ncbi:MAG TPA: hypothetical protein VFO28_14760 [Burkholderiaceae bacterium]|nr:hypothetical protein [Burkholderiaceae bacterium]
MTDRKQRRLELLRRLRELGVEQARAGHVAARAELDERSALCEDTQKRLQALDGWTAEQLGGSGAVSPEVLRLAQLYRGAERQTLERQRADELESQQRTEEARTQLGARFEELSVAEKLAARHASARTNEQLRVGYVESDEAGTRRKQLEAKE